MKSKISVFLLLAAPLLGDTVRVRLFAVVDTEPSRSWPASEAAPPLPAHAAVLRPGGATVSGWKQPDAGRRTFATILAGGFPASPAADRLHLVFEGLTAPRCDGPWIADGGKGPQHDGPSRHALVTQVLQAETFVRGNLAVAFPGGPRDPAVGHTFAWSGLVLLNGASEASEEKASHDFGGNFALTLSDWRAELGPHVPILWARLPPAPETWDETRRRRWDRVRAMQAELATARPLTRCLETAGLPVHPGTADLTPEGWAHLAARASLALAEITAERDSCCPPSE